MDGCFVVCVFRLVVCDLALGDVVCYDVVFLLVACCMIRHAADFELVWFVCDCGYCSVACDVFLLL